MQKSLFSKQDKMGNKGIFFTFISFLIIMAVFFVSLSINESTSKQNEAVADQSAFDSINNRFNDIYNRTISIKTGERGKIQGRILPFTYDSGTDWMLVQQYLPLLNVQTVYDTTFDALNLYEIFAENNGISREYSTSITAQKNSEWGGGAADFNSVILPQCLSIEPEKPSNDKQILLRKGTTSAFDFCPTDFPEDAIKTMEITLAFSTGSDLLSPECGGDFSGCLNKADEANGNPYAIVHLKVTDCVPKCCGTPPTTCGGEPPTTCCITAPEQIIAANVGPGSYIRIPFSGTNEYMRVDFENSDEIVKIYEENLNVKGVLSSAKITFTHPLQELRFNGFQNLSVSKQNFGIERKSG